MSSLSPVMLNERWIKEFHELMIVQNSTLQQSSWESTNPTCKRNNYKKKSEHFGEILNGFHIANLDWNTYIWCCTLLQRDLAIGQGPCASLTFSGMLRIMPKDTRWINSFSTSSVTTIAEIWSCYSLRLAN